MSEMDNNAMTPGEVVRLARTRLKLSQQDLGDKVGCSNQQIGRLESGRRKMTKEWADKLAAPLRISAAEILVPDTSYKMNLEGLPEKGPKLSENYREIHKISKEDFPSPTFPPKEIMNLVGWSIDDLVEKTGITVEQAAEFIAWPKDYLPPSHVIAKVCSALSEHADKVFKKDDRSYTNERLKIDVFETELHRILVGYSKLNINLSGGVENIQDKNVAEFFSDHILGEQSLDKTKQEFLRIQERLNEIQVLRIHGHTKSVSVMGGIREGQPVKLPLWINDDHYQVTFPRNVKFPDQTYIGFEVSDESANLFYNYGSIVVCVDIKSAGRELRQGDVVLVQRVSEDRLHEMLLKEFRVNPNGTKRLASLSDNPEKFKTYEYIEGDEDFQIQALVIGSILHA